MYASWTDERTGKLYRYYIFWCWQCNKHFYTWFEWRDHLAGARGCEERHMAPWVPTGDGWQWKVPKK